MLDCYKEYKKFLYSTDKMDQQQQVATAQNERTEPIQTSTFTAHVLSAMQMAEQYIQSGDKAEFAEQVLMREVAESEMNEEEKELCRAIANTGILKDLFSLVVDATKGKLDVNKVKVRTRKCCFRWFGVCGKKEEGENGNEQEEDQPGSTPIPVEPPLNTQTTEDVFFVNEDALAHSAGGSPSATSLV
jgi:hypothetical protein